MKRLDILLCAAVLAALSASCAKNDPTGANDANKRYLEAWIKIHHPNAEKSGLGVYIIDEQQGSGKEAGSSEDFPFAFVSYTITDLEGNVSETTDEELSKQIGTYKKGSYYGPVIRLRNSTSMTAGQEIVLNGMRTGGSRKAVIPGWFNTKQVRYNSEDGYMANVTGDDTILSLTLHDVIKDITAWQLDSMARYMAHTFHSVPDSLKYGFYYFQTKEPSDTNSFTSGSTVRINYTGQMLNGQVFDTTDEKTAKDWDIYSESKTYNPVTVKMADDYTEIKFSTSSGDTGLIKGFAYCLSRMKTGEKGTCIFYSDLGYEATGSGSIPTYSPLRFDIEMLGATK